MKLFSVRRFTTVEIVYHTIQLVLYLILFVSGGMILLQRLLGVAIVDLAVPVHIHRVTGFVLIAFIVQIIVISIFSKNFRPLWETFLDAFKWFCRDIVWLIKMLGHTFDSRVKLPPSGRFNPGQKLHLLVIYVLLSVYATTGLAMIFVPGALVPWITHTICFAPSVLFLAIHLFLSIINPPTRKAIKGIVTGYVPLDYAQEHHALWQKSADPVSHTSHVSLPAVMLATLASAAVLAGATWYVGFDRVKLKIIHIAQNNAREAFLPGMLISAHAKEPDAKQCTSCHNYFNSPPDSKCLTCHQEILAVVNNNQGYHGSLTGQCRTCHAEHKGLQADITSLDVKGFNHDKARFSLEGKHRGLECKSCHKQQNKNNEPAKTKFIGLAFETCIDCHKDVHDGQMNHTCEICHNENGWKGRHLLFDHSQHSSSKLDALHARVSCDLCHLPDKDKIIRYSPLPQQCDTCHTDIVDFVNGKLPDGNAGADPHAGRVACVDCHTTDVAKQLPHQYAEKCADCHNPRYYGLYFDWQKSIARGMKSRLSLIKGLEGNDNGQRECMIAKINIAEKIGFHNIQLSKRLLEDNRPQP